jgi:hypothetical protein
MQEITKKTRKYGKYIPSKCNDAVLIGKISVITNGSNMIELPE